MSLVDKVFGSIPGPLIKQWGISGFYIKHSESQVYDPELGTYANSIDYKTGNPKIATTKIPISLVPLQLQPEEVQGEIQITDIKILIAGSSLGNYYPKTSDMIEYKQAGINRTAKIIVPLGYRGDRPILHSVAARLG